MDPTVFQTSPSAGCIILVVYVDDILITGSNIAGITRVKDYLHRYLTIQDLGTPKYFLGIEFTYRLEKFVLNQQKCLRHTYGGRTNAHCPLIVSLTLGTLPLHYLPMFMSIAKLWGSLFT